MGEHGAIEYRATAEYVHATVTGPRSREFVSRFFRETAETCERLACRRLLIEMQLEGEPLNVTTILDLVRQFVAEIKRHRDPIVMVAFVGPYQDIPTLAGIASANRAVQIGGFTEVSPAQSWLLGETGDGRSQP